VAAFGAATLDKRPARTVAHAATKAVFALAAAIVWLIRTLHSEVVPSWGGSGASVGSRNGYILGIGPPNCHSERHPRKVQRGREIHNSVESCEFAGYPTGNQQVDGWKNPYTPRVSGRSREYSNRRLPSLFSLLLWREDLL